MAIVSSGLAVFSAHPAFAASGTWSGLASPDTAWETAGNWVGNVVPGSNAGSAGSSADVVNFVGAPAATLVTVDANRNIAGVTCDPADGTVTFTGFKIGATPNAGNTLYLSAGGTTQYSAFTPTAEVDCDLNSTMVLNGSTYNFTNNSGDAANTLGALRLYGNISPLTSSTITFDGDHGSASTSRAEVYGAISGNISIVKNGVGTWEMNQNGSNPNTYSGDTIINSGILRTSTGTGFDGLGGFSANSHYIVRNGATLRNGVAGNTVRQITLDSGGLLAVSTAASTIINIKSNSGPGLELNYAAPLNQSDILVNAPLTLTGTVNNQGGVSVLMMSGTFGTGRVSIGSTTSPFGLGTAIRVIDVGKGADTNATAANPYDLRIRGPISGTGGLVKKGAGTLQLESSTSTFTGSVEVQAGDLRFSNTAGVNNSLQGVPSLLIDGGNVHLFGDQVQTFSSLTFTKGSTTAGNSNTVLRAPSFAFNIASGDPATLDTGLGDSTGAATLVKTGAGAATFNGALSYTGSTTVSGGVLSLGTDLTASSSLSVSAGTVELRVTASPNRVIHTPSLSVTGTGKVDLKSNKLVTASPIGTWTGSTYTGVAGLIKTGRNGGGWGGATGIITSQTDAAAGNFTTLGVATAAQAKGIAATGTAVWAGQTVTGSETLVMYTYGGDANLDGKINVDDYTRIDFNVPLGVAGWFNGDFNYDGKINVDDYTIIDFNVGIQGAPFPTGEGAGGLSAVAVPEPASLVWTAGALALVRRRRRRA